MASGLPSNVLEAFMKGEHVCRHRERTWNSVFMDQFGEQTYIRYGKAKGGLVGKTHSKEQVACWTLSHHLCNTLSLVYSNMYGETAEDNNSLQDTQHKEVGMRRKQLDGSDRNAIIAEVQKFQNPLSFKPYDPLINIVNGQVAPERVNVDKALAIGENMSAQFKDKLPDGFYSPLKHAISSMQVSKKSVKIGAKTA